MQFLPIIANVSLWSSTSHHNTFTILHEKDTWFTNIFIFFANNAYSRCKLFFLNLRRYLFAGTILSQICLFRKCCFAFWFNIKFYMCLNHLNVHFLIIIRIIKRLTSVRNKQILKIKYETILINNNKPVLQIKRTGKVVKIMSIYMYFTLKTNEKIK